MSDNPPAEHGERPRVTIHYAQTLDGRIATCTGQSQWISGEASLRLAHELRAAHQAVMVGVGTILADNPRLTVRLVDGTSPRRIVVASTLRVPLDAHVLTDGAADTIVATTPRAPEDRITAVRRQGADVVVVPADAGGRVDLGQLLRRLAARGITALLIEGGRELITSALRARLVDRLVVCIAPKVIDSGVEAIGDLHIGHMSEALTFARVRVTTVGEDVIFDGQLQPGPL